MAQPKAYSKLHRKQNKQTTSDNQSLTSLPFPNSFKTEIRMSPEQAQGTLVLASRLLTPQGTNRKFRGPFIVEYRPSNSNSNNNNNNNNSSSENPLLYARVTIAYVNGEPFDERRENELLTGELECSAPTEMVDGAHVFDFAGDETGGSGPVFTEGAAGCKIVLRIEVGDYTTGETLAELCTNEIKVVVAKPR